MNKRIGVVGLALALSVVLLGGLLVLAQGARSASLSANALPATQEIGAATYLTVTWPYEYDQGVDREGLTRLENLWDYTEYDGDMSTLVYTFTVTRGPTVIAVSLTDTHYLSLTALSTMGYTRIDLQATDGELTGTLSDIDFHVKRSPSFSNPLQDQTVTAGESYPELIPLKEFVTDPDGATTDLHFRFLTSPPDALRATINPDQATSYMLGVSPLITYTGVIPLEIEVRSRTGLTATDQFTITVEAADNTAPTLTIPDQALRMDTHKTLDLRDYTVDPDDHDDGNITYTVTEVSDVQLTVSITGSHFLNLVPADGFSGVVSVTVQAQDIFDAIGEATFEVSVLGDITPTLDIPAQTLPINTSKTLDLWLYTSYFAEDMPKLTYTATTPTSDDFTVNITDTRYLNLVSTSSETGAYNVNWEVSDGENGSTGSFTVSVTIPPTLTLVFPPIASSQRLGVEAKGSRTDDLWEYTTYSGDMEDLTYYLTRTQGVDTEITGEIVNGHYAHFQSHQTTGQGSFDLLVTDGEMEAVRSFRVGPESPPVLDFTSSNRPISGALTVPTGKRTYIGEGYPLGIYVYDQTYQDYVRYAAIVNEEDLPEGLATIEYDSDWYLYLEPTSDLVGSYPIEVIVYDSTWLTSTDVFTVTIQHNLYLPLAIRNFPPIPTLLPIDNPDNDAFFHVNWELDGDHYYQVQWDTDPNFSNPQEDTTAYKGINRDDKDDTIKAGVYYWRVRVMMDGRETPWSNVQSVQVDNLAYLYVQPLCAFGLKIEVWGAPGAFEQTYSDEYCNQTVWWRTVPAGTYNTRLTWIGGSIVDTVAPTALGNARYYIIAGDRPPAWQAY